MRILGTKAFRDSAIATGLFAGALILRLQSITLVPPIWNSEASEALDAADIALGRTLPLVLASQPHIGAVAAYPLALALRLFGLDPFTPRIFVAVVAALTVVATFLLARILGSWLAGSVAGALLATNAFHIFINSHVFWTNSITPFLTTLALLALVIAVERSQNPSEATPEKWLVLSAMFFGLALQSHLSVLGLLPGVGIWLWTHPSKPLNLRARSTWFAAAGCLLAYSNVIVYNLTSGFHTLAVVSAKSYALPEENVMASGFLDRLQQLLIELARIISSNAPITPALETQKITLDLSTIALTLWLLIALIVNLKKGRALFFWAMLSTALVIGFSNKVYGLGYAERYIMFLLPIAFTAMGLAVEDGWRWLREKNFSTPLTALIGAMGAIALVLLIAQPMQSLDDYYRREIAAGRSNEAYIEWTNIALPYSREGYQALISESLNREQAVSGSNYGLALDYMLRMKNIATKLAPLDDLYSRLRNSPETKAILFLDRAEFASLRGALPLCAIDRKPDRVIAIYPGMDAACPP